VGIRGQVYGARADLIVVDDAVDNTNVGDFDKQIDWLLGIVGSRLAPRSGRLLVVGTRIAARDMYSELLEPTRYYGGSSPWTHLQQPAVLEFADDPRDWVTLWPFADSPADPEELPNEDGSFTRWDGPTLAEVRNGIAPAQWSRIYQQEQVAEDAVFDAELVVSACQARPAGAIPDDPRLGREGGMSGLRLIAGLDPATVGHTAAVLVGVCLKTGVRYVVDAHNEAGMSPESMRNLIRGWTERFGVQSGVLNGTRSSVFDSGCELCRGWRRVCDSYEHMTAR
jgi:Terminase-like family.